MFEAKLAFPNQRSALNVVHAQVYDHPRAPLINDAHMDDLPVLAGAVDDPAAGRRGTLNVGTAAGPGLVPGRVAQQPDTTLAWGRQVARGDPQCSRGAGSTADGRGRLTRLG